MKSLRHGILQGVILAAAVLLPGRPSGSEFDDLKANLDLPYDALGSSEEEEDAPELIFFYGDTYEADAVVFCLDESRSMRHHSRWEIQKREVARAIRDLHQEAEFGLVFYGANAYSFRDTLTKADEGGKQAALAYVNSRQLSLGTCLGPGVVRSLRMLQRSSRKYRTVIVVSDGRPTVCPFVRGQGRDEALIQEILQQTVTANPGLQIRIHTIYVGTDNDPRAIDFMRRLAERHNGTFRIVNH